jgi:hypothetical protein
MRRREGVVIQRRDSDGTLSINVYFNAACDQEEVGLKKICDTVRFCIAD